MHFPIIELKNHRIPKDERMSDCELYDDACVNYNTDYFGDEYTDEERRDYIMDGSLQNLLEGIATVNVAEESITFFDYETINDTIRKQMRACLERLLYTLEDKDKKVRPNDLMYEGRFWRDYNELFHYDGCAHTAGSLISDAVWFAEQTLYIGAMFDAHI